MESTGKLQQFLALILLGLATSGLAASAGNHDWGTGPKWGAGASAPLRQSNLPETQALLRHDELVPTLNRTYAMRYEAQYGHLWPAVDRQIAPYLPKPKRPPAVKRSRFQSVDRAHPHVPHPLIQTYK